MGCRTPVGHVPFRLQQIGTCFHNFFLPCFTTLLSWSPVSKLCNGLFVQTALSPMGRSRGGMEEAGCPVSDHGWQNGRSARLPNAAVSGFGVHGTRQARSVNEFGIIWCTNPKPCLYLVRSLRPDP